MSREAVLIALGILVAASPYAGIPLSTLAVVLPLAGLSVAAIAFTQRTRTRTLAHVSSRNPAVVHSYEAQDA